MKAITLNLGCAGPNRAKFVGPAHKWATEVRDAGIDLVFAQEIPGEERWVSSWAPEYAVFVDNESKWRTRSALMVRSEHEPEPFELPTRGYHGSYVASATIGGTALLSVHASPNPVNDKWRAAWESTNQSLPEKRVAESRLWDADLLLRTVELCGQALVAGDWNEAREWRASNSGHEFFARVEQAGLVDCTMRDWDQERSTCKPQYGTQYQTDHVFASNAIADRVAKTELVEQKPLAGGSDHIPISFDLDL